MIRSDTLKEIIYNNDYLTDEDITEKTYRARGVIINSNDEILLGYCDELYQFPGGHVEDNETILECLIREIKEETGIELNYNDKPFYIVKYYNKDYPKKGINRYTEFDYFLIKTDQKPNLNNTNYDEYEKENNYELKYIKLDKLKKEFNKTINLNKRSKDLYPLFLKILEEIDDKISTN